MNSGLFFNNKKYISAREASKLTGYSQDYIGRLSRTNKIESKQIGRKWYISEESILNYKNYPTGFEVFNNFKTEEKKIEVEAPKTTPQVERIIQIVTPPHTPAKSLNRKMWLIASGVVLTSILISTNVLDLKAAYRGVASFAKNFLPAQVATSLPTSNTKISTDSLMNAYKNYVSPNTQSGITVNDTLSAWKSYLTPKPKTSTTAVITKTPTTIAKINNSSLLSALRSLLSTDLPDDIALKLRGPQGPQGPEGVAGPQGPSGVSGYTFSSSPPPIQYNPGPVGVTGGFANLGVQDLNTKILTVTGNSELGGTLRVAGDTTLSGTISVTGNSTLSGDVNIAGTLTTSGTFNPSLTQGSVFFQGASGLTEDNANFFYDSTNHRLGLGNLAPTQTLDITGTVTSSGNTTLATGAGTTNTFGSGASSINTIGSTTTPGILTLHGATTLDNNFTQTGANTFDTGTGAVSLNGATTITGSNTFSTGTGIVTLNNVNTNLVATNPVIDTTDGASTLNINTVNNRPVTFGTGTVTIPNLAVTNSQTGVGTFNINSDATTETIFSVTGNSLTSGTAIGKTITANAGNGQVTKGEVVNLTDSTTAGGGFTGIGIAVTGSGTGSGNKYLLSLSPNTANNEVVFDNSGAFRPTTSVASNTATIGSPSFYWKNGYFDQITANNIAGTVVSGATSSTIWTIGSTEAGDVNEALVFQRNSGSGNATLQWNAGASDLRYLTANYPLNSTYTVDDSSIGTGINLLSANLTNNTTSGTQKLLSLTNTGTGTTENGIYINNTGTGTTAFEIAGTWTNGIVTNNNTINTGTGSITSGLINGQTISSTANFTGTVGVSGALTAASFNGNTITTGTGTLTLAAGKTFTASNTLTLAGTDGSTLDIGTGGTLGTNAFSSVAYLPLAGGTLTGNLLFTDNTYDIGANGATRPRTGYFGTSVISPYIIGGTGTTSDLFLQTTSGVGAAGADMHFLVGNNGGTEAVTILNSGNVGIGTTSPQSNLPLSVSSTSGKSAYFAGNIGVGTTNPVSAFTAGSGGAFTSYTPDNAWSTSFYTGSDGWAHIGSPNASVGFILASSPIMVFGTTGATIQGGGADLNFNLPSGGSMNFGLRTDGVYTNINSYKFAELVGSQFKTGLGSQGQVTLTTNLNQDDVLLKRNVTGSFTEAGSILNLQKDITGTSTYSGNYLKWGTTATGIGVIDENGSVGIGTTNPSLPLDVISENPNANFGGGDKIIVSSFHTNTADKPGVALGYDLTASAGIVAAGTQALGAPLAFWTYNGSVWGERMRISKDGNVGIGTTNPSALLSVGSSSQFQVNSSGNITAVLATTNNENIADSIPIRNSSGTFVSDTLTYNLGNDSLQVGTNPIVIGASQVRNTTGTFQINTGDGSSALALNPSGGNVGIGTTAPSTNANLEVFSTGNTISRVRTSSITGYSDIQLRNDQNSALRALDVQYSGSSYSGSLLTSSPTGEIGAVSTSGAYPLVLGTNNTARVTIDSAGNVGIGTTNPAAKLDVNGDIQLPDNGTIRFGAANTQQPKIVDGGNQLLQLWATGATNATPEWEIGGNSGMIFRSNEGIGANSRAFLFDTRNNLNVSGARLLEIRNATVPKFAITYDGSVGIGTDTPTANLHISGTNQAMKLGDSGSSTLYMSGTSNYIAMQSSQFNFTTAQANGFTFTGGNVGIGTTNPGFLLDITKSTSGEAIRINTTAAELGIRIVANSKTWGLYNSSGIANQGFGFYDSGNAAWRLAIDGTSGNVGIGTTAPNSLLEISSSAPILKITNSSAFSTSNTAILHFVANTSIQARQIANLTANFSDTTDATRTGLLSFLVDDAGVLDTKMVIKGSNVGIGTTSPGTTLELNTTGQTRLTIRNSTVSAGSKANLDFLTGTGVVSPTNVMGQIRASIASISPLVSGLDFFVNSGDTSNQAMTILGSGNVGIGTTNPAQMLSLYGTSATDAGIKISSNAGNTNTILKAVDASGGLQIQNGLGQPIMSFLNFSGGGNVGIGVTNPVTLLSINAGSSGGDYTKGLMISHNGIDDSGGLSLWHSDAGQTNEYIDSRYDSAAAAMNFRMRVKGTPVNAMTILGNGNVGIGTTNPQGILHIKSTDLGTIFQTADANSRLQNFYWNSSGTQIGKIGTNFDGTGSVTLDFTAGSGSTAQMSIDPTTGNVGIGTASPGSKLEVNGVISSPNQALSGTFQPAYTWSRTGGAVAGAIGYDNGASPLAVYMGATTAHSLELITNNTTQMTILSGGNVGIGTTNPGAKLDVDAGATSGLGLLKVRTEAGTGTQAGIMFSVNPTAGRDKGAIYFQETNGGAHYSGDLVFALGAGGDASQVSTSNEKMRITSGGNVGIGIDPGNGSNRFLIKSAGATSATYIIDAINSSAADQFYIRSDGYGFTNQAAWNYASDRRLKENINYIDSGSLDKISQLKPASFDYINGVKNNLGFIAQDVQGVIPEAVSVTNEQTGMLGLKTDFIIPYLVGAVQELNTKVENNYADLNLKLEGYEARIAALEANQNNTTGGGIEALGQYAVDFFAYGVQSVVDGVVYMKNLAVEKLTIGSSENPTGFMIYDKVTKAPYCVSMIAGVLASEPGTCDPVPEVVTPPEETPPPATPEDGQAPTCTDGIQNQDETGIDTGGVCDVPPEVTVDTTAPVITLTGDAEITLNVGDTYTELGATATDDTDGSVAVIVTGSVDTNTAGTYTIHYNASDEALNNAIEVIRTVNVVEVAP